MTPNWPIIALLGGSLVSPLPAVVTAQSSQTALERRLQRVERLLDSSALRNLLQRVDTQQREIRALQGDNDVLKHKLQGLEQRLSAITAAPPAEPAPPAAAPEASNDSVTPAATSAATNAPTSTDPAQEQAAYNTAFQLLRDADYAAAVSALQQLLRDYPNGRYAANAQYWIGEAHYVEQQYPPAMQAFEQVTKDYPDSPKTPDAMLKIGIILAEQGKQDDAQQIFQQLMRDFPDSSAASLASVRIKQ